MLIRTTTETREEQDQRHAEYEAARANGTFPVASFSKKDPKPPFFIRTPDEVTAVNAFRNEQGRPALCHGEAMTAEDISLVEHFREQREPDGVDIGVDEVSIPSRYRNSGDMNELQLATEAAREYDALKQGGFFKSDPTHGEEDHRENHIIRSVERALKQK